MTGVAAADGSAHTGSSIGCGRPRLLFVTLMLGHMAQGLAFTAFAAALPQMAHDLGPHGEFVAQMTLSVAALGLVIGALASGWILEWGGTRGVLLGAALTYGIAGAGGLVLRDPVFLLATRFAVGFSAACMVTTCVWAMTVEYAGHRLAQALGVCNALGSAIALTGMLAGGFLAAYGGWPLAFMQFPVFALLACALLLASLRQVRPAPVAAGARRERYFAHLLPLYLLAALLFAVMFTGSIQLPFLLAQDGVASSASRSIIMSGVTVLAAVTGFAYGPLERRLGSNGAFLLGLLCATASLAVISACRSVALVATGAGLMGLFVALTAPYLYHSAAVRSEQHSRNRALGFLSAFNFLGGFLNPLIFSPVSRVLGMRGLFLLIALVMLILALRTLARLLQERSTARAT
jgi:MFS family permease